MKSNLSKVFWGVWLLASGLLNAGIFTKALFENEGTISSVGWAAVGELALFVLLFVLVIALLAFGLYELIDAWKNWK